MFWKKFFSKSKNIRSFKRIDELSLEKREFFELIEGYFSVLAKELERGNQSLFAEYLKYISEIINIQLEKNPLLFYADGFLGLSRDNNHDAAFRLMLVPAICLSPLQTIVQQYGILMRKALVIQQKNNIILLEDSICNFLKITVKQEGAKPFLDIFLQTYGEFILYCLKNGYNSYTHIFTLWFRRLYRPYRFLSAPTFRDEYTQVLHDNFIYHGKLIITHGGIEDFYSFCEAYVAELPSSVTKDEYRKLFADFSIFAAYCIFAGKAKYIKAIWEAKQPPDADGEWIGLDYCPNSINELFALFFEHSYLFDRYHNLSGKHGLKNYLRQYFLLLFLKICDTDMHYSLDNLSIPKLRAIKSMCNELKNELQSSTDLLDLLLDVNIPIQKKDIGFKEIKRLEDNLNKHENDIKTHSAFSSILQENYKLKAKKSYASHCVFRKLSLFSIPEMKIEQEDTGELFLDEVGNSYINAGDILGQMVAIKENQQVIEQLISDANTTKIPIEELKTFICEKPCIAFVDALTKIALAEERLVHFLHSKQYQLESFGKIEINGNKIIAFDFPVYCRCSGVILFSLPEDYAISDDFEPDLDIQIEKIEDKAKIQVQTKLQETRKSLSIWYFYPEA